jgi:hypothetical protein
MAKRERKLTREQERAERLEDKLHRLRDPLLPHRDPPKRKKPVHPNVAPGDMPHWDYTS